MTTTKTEKGFWLCDPMAGTSIVRDTTVPHSLYTDDEGRRWKIVEAHATGHEEEDELANGDKVFLVEYEVTMTLLTEEEIEKMLAEAN